MRIIYRNKPLEQVLVAVNLLAGLLVVASFAFIVAGGIQSHLIQETLAGRYVNESTWYLGIGIATLFAQVLLAITAIKMSYQHRE